MNRRPSGYESVSAEIAWIDCTIRHGLDDISAQSGRFRPVLSNWCADVFPVVGQNVGQPNCPLPAYAVSTIKTDRIPISFTSHFRRLPKQPRALPVLLPKYPMERGHTAHPHQLTDFLHGKVRVDQIILHQRHPLLL